MEEELTSVRKKLRQLNGTKDRLSQQIDHLDFDDPHYDRKYQDLQDRQNAVYDEIAATEASLAEVQMRIENVQKNKISGDNVYQFLLYFDQLYDQFSDAEKKEFMRSFIERVEIYPEKQPNGRILRHIDFRFLVYYNGQEVNGIDWDKESTVDRVFSDYLPLTTWQICVIGALLEIITGVLSEKEALSGIMLSLIFLLIGALGMGNAVVSSGAGDVVTSAIQSILGSNPNPWIATIILWLAAFIITQFMSNLALMTAMEPLVYLLCMTYGWNPIGLVYMVNTACVPRLFSNTFNF